MRCRNLVIADSEIVQPCRNSILSRSDLVTGVRLYKRTLFGNYRDFSNPGVVLKPRHFVENPRRKVLGMLGMTGEYNLSNIRSYSDEFGIDSNGRMDKGTIKKLFRNKYPSKDKRISSLSLESM